MKLKRKITSFYIAIFCSFTSHASADEMYIKQIDKMTGSAIPFTVISNDLKNNAIEKGMIEIRNGGYGSDMTAHPTNKNQFYALTDRGPNAVYKNEQYGAGKIFPIADYTPRIGLFEVQKYGQIVLIKNILLKRPDGTLITGLPNSSALGGTGETPYSATGDPIVEDPTKPFDAKSNKIKLDDFGLDGEGLAALDDGTFWVSDEYGPHLVHFDKNGIEIGRINPFVNDGRNQLNLPAEFANRRANRGMEGLAITPDQTTLVGTMQSTMLNPNKTVKDLNLVRIVSVNLKTKEVQQFLYKQEKNQNANSGIAALSDNQFLVIERDGSFLRDKKDAMKHIYRIDLDSGTDLESIENNGVLTQDPKLGLLINGQTLEQAVLDHGWDVLKKNNINVVNKSLVVDLVKELKYPHDKLEGMWIINSNTLAVINDDDFSMWSKAGKLEQKYLDNNKIVIDNSTLYVIDDVALKK
ncbi:esterase-like activity of phytase family protein [Psychromonas sp.]|nr:esterase-like activity of phytase family protein [Psychromonas sp.]